MNAIVPAESAAAIAERVIISGDLSKLSPQERVNYYNEVCKSVGLNPLTKPFEYITLNGRLTLYALRACTDQLRSIYSVSVEEMTESERDGVFIVTAKVRNGQGRTDIAKGAVSIGGLKGEGLANALMKAETKAKRRATLSICGLGWLDESEVDSIPGAVKGAPSEPPAITQDPDVTEGVKNWVEKQKAIINAAQAMPGLYAWLDGVASLDGQSGDMAQPDGQSALGRLKRKAPEAFAEINACYQARVEALSKK